MGPTWGRCSGRRARCRAECSGAEQGAQLRAAGLGLRVWTCLHTFSTGGLHGWRVGGSPPWVEAGWVKFAPSAGPQAV